MIDQEPSVSRLGVFFSRAFLSTDYWRKRDSSWLRGVLNTTSVARENCANKCVMYTLLFLLWITRALSFFQVLYNRKGVWSSYKLWSALRHIDFSLSLSPHSTKFMVDTSRILKTLRHFSRLYVKNYTIHIHTHSRFPTDQNASRLKEIMRWIIVACFPFLSYGTQTALKLQ